MGRHRWARRGVLGAVLALPVLVRAQQAETWRIIVNFPPGGLLDGTARLLAERAQREGRVPTVVENRAGAAGAVGAAAAARAAPDGRTVLASIDTPFTVNPHLIRDQGFDAAQDFVPVALVNSFPLALLVHPSSPARDLAGFLAAARAQPLFYVSAGIGSPGHLAMEYLRQTTGLPAAAFEHLPQRGNTEALTTLLAGTVQAGFLAIGAGRTWCARAGCGRSPSPARAATRPCRRCRPWPRAAGRASTCASAPC